jgi:hypothetical protein
MMSTSPSVRVQITPVEVTLISPTTAALYPSWSPTYARHRDPAPARAAALLLCQRDAGTLTSGCARLCCRPATLPIGCRDAYVGMRRGRRRGAERPRHFPTRILTGYHRRGVVAQGAASPCASGRRSDHGVPCPDGAYDADIHHVAAYSRPVLQTPVTTGHQGPLT